MGRCFSLYFLPETAESHSACPSKPGEWLEKHGQAMQQADYYAQMDENEYLFDPEIGEFGPEDIIETAKHLGDFDGPHGAENPSLPSSLLEYQTVNLLDKVPGIKTFGSKTSQL